MSHGKQNGFTLIELMLAMTFISVLLVAIAMTTIQISNIYNKGITLREVNQAGRVITDDLQRSISSSSPFDVTPKKNDTDIATMTSHYVVRDGGGRLCVGGYTYAWNYGKAIAGGTGAPDVFNKYEDGTPVRFVKVRDGGNLCTNSAAKIIRENASEMLTSSDRDLVVHTFDIKQTSAEPSTEQSIYSITMLIGTNDRDQLTTNDASCKPPAEGVGDEQYCSVNQFDIIARAGNRSGGDQ
jgi:prepilin-type N-terminal cleavage/methylation domain-containing protein